MERAQEIKEAYGQRAKDYILTGLGRHEVRGRVLCPLHDDKKPSMTWFDDGYMWRCHACKGQIDIYTYLTEYENLTFSPSSRKGGRYGGNGFEINSINFPEIRSS